MTFLPVVERELRVAARRGTTRWARFALTAVLTLITMNFFAGSGSVNPGRTGQSAYVWLLSAAFVLACAACTLTADSLSAEHREGTLGLLFLTDLRTWDITLGKLASAGLGAAYAGMAFIPLLVLPLLAGGVTGPEAARSGMALLAILLFALAAGLAASARETDRLRAVRRAALWVLGALIVPIVAGWFGAFWPVSMIRLISPLTTLRQAQDTAYRAVPADFWISVGFQLLHAAFLLVWAGRCLPRSLIEPVLHAPVAPPEPPKEPEPWSADSFSNASYNAVNPPRLRPQLPRPFDDARPLEWLVRRQRGQRALCWSAAASWFVSSTLGFGLQNLWGFRVAGPTVPLGWYLLYQIGWVGDALLAWAACRFFFEARRSGELEMLLTTPVGAQALVSAHWAAMKRLLRGPMLLVFAPLLLQAGCSLLVFRIGTAGRFGPYSLYETLYGILRPLQVLVVLVALNWLGMFFGMTARRLISAVGLTVGFAVALPMIIQSLMQFALRLFLVPGPGSMSWTVLTLTYFPVDYALLLALTYWASRRLRRGRLGEPMHLDWRHDLPAALGRCAAWVRAFP